MRKKILDSVLTLLDQGESWGNISFDQIAKEVNVSATDVTSIFADKNDIFPSLLTRVDAQMEQECDNHLLKEKPHDRVFEVFMIRFDILNQNRIAWRHLFFETFKNPPLFRKALPHFHNSMDIVLRICDLNGRNGTSPLPLRTGALALVYLNAVRVWLNDETTDMAPTMAELDRGLTRLDKVLAGIPDALKAFI